jgi:hypothetical protein
LLLSLSCFSQVKDTTRSCECSFNYNIKYPKAAEKNNISGTVIIEMDSNDSCLLSNPIILKGVGYGCDEEALRIVRQMIMNENKCVIKCQSRGCKSKKIKQSINFKKPEE